MDDTDKFIEFFNKRIHPSGVLKSINDFANLDKVILPDYILSWYDLDENASIHCIRKAASNLDNASKKNIIFYNFRNSLTTGNKIKLSREELNIILFLIQIFNDELNSRDGKRIKKLQKLRPLYVWVVYNILLPKLTIKERKKATSSKVEHFGINPLHKYISINDEVGKDWYID